LVGKLAVDARFRPQGRGLAWQLVDDNSGGIVGAGRLVNTGGLVWFHGAPTRLLFTAAQIGPERRRQPRRAGVAPR